MAGADQLITDRTINDVNNRTKKGTYDASDFNRVISAIKTIISEFDESGYTIPLPCDREFDMAENLTPYYADLYLQNFLWFKSFLSGFSGVPSIPDSMSKFDYKKANDLERIVLLAVQTLEQIPNYSPKCGDAVCGGDYL